jgi:hypothetical protein
MDCAGPLECFAHPPGARGCSVLAKQLKKVLWSWIGEEHVAIYHTIIEITRQVDPAVVVVNYTFRPAVDATRQQNQLHAIVSPLALVDLFALLQPYGNALWKYPALARVPLAFSLWTGQWSYADYASLGTGFLFPVPLHQIPENIYVTLHLAYKVLINPSTRATMKYLREHDINSGLFLIHGPDIPLLRRLF